MTYSPVRNPITSAEDVNTKTSNSGTGWSGSTWTGAWELPERDFVRVSVLADVGGTIFFEFGYDGSTVSSTFPTAGFDLATFHEYHGADLAGRWFRVRIVFDSLPTNVDIFTYYSNNAPALNSPLSQSVAADQDATTVKSVVHGESTGSAGSFLQAKVSPGGALLTGSFETEISLSRVPQYEIGTKFGRNPDIGTISAPEDLWNGGGLYPGFNATANENIEVLSSDVNDQGNQISSGTATGGSATTLVDTGADFVTTDGVAVGDMLINTTRSIHGIITAVTATTITVFRMLGDNPFTAMTNAASDAYIVVNANDTGAAVVRIEQLLNANFQRQPSRYVVLNGTTGVTVTGNYMRCSRAKVIHAGASAQAEGTITIRQATTTANVFAVMPPGFNQTTIGAFTVPAGFTCIIKRIRVSITRASGAAGSATISLNARPYGQVFNALRVFGVQTGSPSEFENIGGDGLPPGTDLKYRIDDVSDNLTIAEGAFEYLLIAE